MSRGVMSPIIRVGRAAGAVGAHVGNTDGWEVALDGGARWRASIWALTIGWGFDNFAPLSAVPQIWTRHISPRGYPLTGAAWLGFFFNWTGMKCA